MKKMGVAIVSVVVGLSASTLFLWGHYQIQPLQSPPYAQENPVYEARNLRCPDPTIVDARAVILKASDEPGKEQSVFYIRSEETPVKDLEKRLHDVFATRAEKTVYLVDAAAIEKPETSELLGLLRKSMDVDRICVIDPQKPPKWYPPPEIVSPKLGGF